MVTRLTYFSKDPNGLGRGQGFYYLRGGVADNKYLMNGRKTYKGPYYSKYSADRDTAKLSTGWKIDKIGKPKEVAKKYAHVSDGDLARRTIQY